MAQLKLVAEPRTTTSRWLEEHFDGEAEVSAFVHHFSQNFVSREGTRIPPKNVYSRILRDEMRGIVTRTPFALYEDANSPGNDGSP